MGIEPTTEAWEAAMLPLHQGRFLKMSTAIGSLKRPGIKFSEVFAQLLKSLTSTGPSERS